MSKVAILSLCMAVLCLSACASRPHVTTDFDSHYNFSALKTFSVKEPLSDSRENILISPFTLSFLRNLVTSEFSKHYQLVADSGSADFWVSYHLVMEEKLESRVFENSYGVGFGGRAYPSPVFYPLALDTGVRVYSQGSLIVDITDAKTQQPIWRGISEKRLSKQLSPQKQREMLTSALEEVLAQFPPVK